MIIIIANAIAGCRHGKCCTLFTNTIPAILSALLTLGVATIHTTKLAIIVNVEIVNTTGASAIPFCAYISTFFMVIRKGVLTFPLLDRIVLTLVVNVTDNVDTLPHSVE